MREEPQSPPPPSRRRALSQLVAPARLRESLALNQPASVRNATVAGVQAAAAVVLVAAALHLSPWSPLAGFGGLGALAALFGRFAPLARRRRVVLTAGALLVLPVAVLSLLAWAGLPPLPMLLALGAMAGLLASLAHRTQMGPPGAVIFIFAASAALSPPADAVALAGRAVATALGVASAWLLCLLTDHWRDLNVAPAPAATAAAPPPPPPPPPGYAPLLALRVGLCATLAAGLAHGAGWSHPAWAAIGAVAVLQGAHLPGTVHRAWQRTLGTVIGAAVAWAILSTSPSFWTLLIAVAMLQILTEVVIGFNYALGQIFVTPMALLMTTLASHGEPATMATSRVYDTALGAAVGIVLALVFSSLDERVHLARHHSAQQTPRR